VELAAYAERAVRLVNTEDTLRGRDHLSTLEDLRSLVQLDGPSPRRVTESDLSALRALRAPTRRLFELGAGGRVRETVDALNRFLRAYPVHPQVTGHDASDWHLHLADGATRLADCYAAGAFMGLAVLVTSLGTGRLGVCQATPCRDVFIDTSTNRSRRYCSDRCATRANVAAYRARRRAQVTRTLHDAKAAVR
jgi:predicted RNA-binding Zn ribbon-like protein